MPRTIHSILAVAFACALLTGCDSPAPRQPDPTTPAAPRFASDEEALAAAEEAYGAFLETADQIVRDGGADDARLAPFLSEELYMEESEGFAEMRADGRRGIGYTTFTLVLQRWDPGSLVVSTCQDITNTDLVDAHGQSIVTSDRRLRLPFEIEFDPDSMRIVRKTFLRDQEC